MTDRAGARVRFLQCGLSAAQADEVAGLDEEAWDELAVLACSPSYSITEFTRERGCSLFEATRRVGRLPLVEIDARGAIVANPLLLRMLRECRPDLLLTRARELAAGRSPSAAVATLLRGGDLVGAARLAERSIEVVPALDAESHVLLAELPQTVLRTFPRLWLSVGMPRWWHDDTDEMVENAIAALDAAAPEDIDTRFGLGLMICPTLVGRGQRERAVAICDRFLQAARSSQVAPHHPILAILYEAMWRTFDEREFDVEAVRAACTPLFGNPGVYIIFLLMPLWTWCRIHGETVKALETSAAAVETARELMPGSYIDALGGAAYTAWWAGDDAQLQRFIALHREAMDRGGFQRAHGFFARAVLGDVASDAVRDIARPWFVAEGLLMRASLREGAAEARNDLLEAIHIVDRLGFREMELTARIALAVFDEERRSEHIHRAKAIATRIGTPELLAAAEELAASDGHSARHYGAIIRRFERFRPPTIHLSLARRTLTLGDRSVKLSRQQLAIVTLLTFADAPIPRRELSEAVSVGGAMIPERVLEVQLARLRRTFGREVVVHDGTGYHIGIRFTSDWHEATDAQVLTGIVEAVRRVAADSPALHPIALRIEAATHERLRKQIRIVRSAHG